MDRITISDLKEDFKNHRLRTTFFCLLGGYAGSFVAEAFIVDYILLRIAFAVIGAFIFHMLTFRFSAFLDFLEQIRWKYIIGTIFILSICIPLGFALGVSLVGVENIASFAAISFGGKIIVVLCTICGFIVGLALSVLGIAIDD